MSHDEVGAALRQVANHIESREAQLRKMLRRREALTPETTKGHADGLHEAAVIVRTAAGGTR